jgi:hypothetical protein
MINYIELAKNIGPISLIPWTDRNYLLNEIRQLKIGAKVLEVGTFIAGTTAYMARERSDIEIFTIDINKWNPNSHLISHVKSVYGLDEVNDSVVYNIQRATASLYPNIKLLTGESLSLDIDNLDLVYLDGDHHYEIVLQELHYYYDRLNDNGIIMGDDVDAIDVYDALRIFCLEKDIEFSIFNKTFKIRKQSVTVNSEDFITQNLLAHGPRFRTRLKDLEKFKIIPL